MTVGPLSHESRALEVEKRVETGLVLSPTDRIAQTIQYAIERGISPEVVEKLYDVQQKMLHDAAEAEFAEARADFQKHCPAIVRSKKVTMPGKSGSGFSFQQFTLDDIMDAVRDPLAERGMSVSFSASVAGSVFTVKAILSHKNGAKPIDSEFPITTASNNPGMSDQHKWVGAMTFAKRYALINVLGLPLADPDPEGLHDPTTVTPEQAANLTALLEETKSDVAAFLRIYGAASVAEMLKVNYTAAVGVLERKRKAAEVKP